MAVEVTRRVCDQLWHQLLQHLEVVQIPVASGCNQRFTAYLHIVVDLLSLETATTHCEHTVPTRFQKQRTKVDVAVLNATFHLKAEHNICLF